MLTFIHQPLKKLSCCFLSLVCLLVWCVPASAISIKEEEELAREFMKVVMRQFELIEDPLILDFVKQVGHRILDQIPSQPFQFHFYIIQDEVYNAFALPAGHIFINSGLLAVMDSEDELAGILAHEIAHVVCRHISQRIEQSKKINLATMAGILAGILVGASTGNAEAMQAVTIGSAAAGQTASLAYSRENETQADQLGLGYLTKAGYTGAGMLNIFKKIRSKRWFEAPDYMMTHPALEERIAKIDTDMAVHEKQTHRRPQPVKPESLLFRRVKTRLKALYTNSEDALNDFKTNLTRQPNNPDAAYGYGLAAARVGKRKEAVEFLRKALQQEALDPVILSDLGRIYFLDGHYEEALNTLEGAVSLPLVNPEAYFFLGRTRMEMGQLQAAADAFEMLLKTHPNHTATYQFLGEIYGKLEQMPDAHYYLGLFHFRKGDFRVARYHLDRASKSIQDPTKLEIIKKTVKAIGKLPKEQPLR
jgi:predicted Zn-dependent protease